MSVTIPIVKTEGVLGGKPRIEGTRIGVHHVGVPIRELGRDRDDVAESLGLSDAEIESALEYYDEHPDEMEAIREAAAATAERIRAQSRAHDIDDEDEDANTV